MALREWWSHVKRHPKMGVVSTLFAVFLVFFNLPGYFNNFRSWRKALTHMESDTFKKICVAVGILVFLGYHVLWPWLSKPVTSLVENGSDSGRPPTSAGASLNKRHGESTDKDRRIKRLENLVEMGRKLETDSLRFNFDEYRHQVDQYGIAAASAFPDDRQLSRLLKKERKARYKWIPNKGESEDSAQRIRRALERKLAAEKNRN